MSIKTLNKSFAKATLVVESARASLNARKKISEDAGAVTALTTGPVNAPTIFVVNSTGISFNTLSEKIKASCGVASTVEQTGDSITISSTSPGQVQRILKLLRISATVQGDVINDPMIDNPPSA